MHNLFLGQSFSLSRIICCSFMFRGSSLGLVSLLFLMISFLLFIHLRCVGHLYQRNEIQDIHYHRHRSTSPLKLKAITNYTMYINPFWSALHKAKHDELPSINGVPIHYVCEREKKNIYWSDLPYANIRRPSPTKSFCCVIHSFQHPVRGQTVGMCIDRIGLSEIYGEIERSRKRKRGEK